MAAPSIEVGGNLAEALSNGRRRSAKKAFDENLPSNTLIKRWTESEEEAVVSWANRHRPDAPPSFRRGRAIRADQEG